MSENHHHYANQIRDAFESITERLPSILDSSEDVSLSLSGESSNFTRCTQSKIRQSTVVQQAQLTVTFYKNKKTFRVDIPFSSDQQDNTQHVSKAIDQARGLVDLIPEDPFFTPCEGQEKSHFSSKREGYTHREIVQEVLSTSSSLDLAGLISSGSMMRASSNSQGMCHWFDTSSFVVDYSLYNPKQDAVKDLYAGTSWDPETIKRKINDASYKLGFLNKEPKQLKPGQYRTYLAPSAVSTILGMMSWHGVSGASLKQGQSSFQNLYDKKKALSPKFSFQEDFTLGLSPAFNSLGEISPTILPIIQEGKLANLLVSKRTAIEYDMACNHAEVNESLRSTAIEKGSLSESHILKTIGEGLYISDLHYLNWSDFQTGRLTGMTRYACFWIENGELSAPITNMRFDDSFYAFWGQHLEDCTDFTHVFPETSTYGGRSLGGAAVPGMLLKSFNLTL